MKLIELRSLLLISCYLVVEVDEVVEVDASTRSGSVSS